MRIDPTVYTGRPSDGRLPQEEAIYDKLEELSIPYTRVDHDHADTMEDCLQIESVLGGRICKNLFLCNRQQTEFYLLLMPGDKPFRTKELSKLLRVSRLSFAPEEDMLELLDIQPGAVSIMGLMNDAGRRVRLVVDGEVLRQEYFGCHPCVNTSSLKLRTSDVFEKYLPSTGHELTVVELTGAD